MRTGSSIRVVSSDAFAVEKLRTMSAFGAELTLVESEGGQITPDLLPRMIETARLFAAEPDAYWTNQLHNRDSLIGYRQIGVELLDQMDRGIDVFCCAAGTSTGLNVVGAIGLASEFGAGHTVVTVAVDTGLKYLAGDLYAD